MDKKTYEAPKLEEVGSFEDVTLGLSTGTLLDADLEVGDVATFLS